MINPSLSFVLLFVADPLKSKVFYEAILGLPSVEEAPTFVRFALANGVMLGQSEICLPEKDVDGVYAAWQGRGGELCASSH